MHYLPVWQLSKHVPFVSNALAPYKTLEYFLRHSADIGSKRCHHDYEVLSNLRISGTRGLYVRCLPRYPAEHWNTGLSSHSLTRTSFTVLFKIDLSHERQKVTNLSIRGLQWS